MNSDLTLRPQPARPQQPLDPRQRGWAWAPAATAPAERTPEERVSPTRYGSPGLTCRGERGSWTAATGPRAGAEAAGARPRGPECPRWRRAGREAGGLPQAGAARRRGREDLALPLAPGRRRRRRHFAFDSVSPRPHSAAIYRMCAFPGVACAGAEDWGLLAARPRGSERAACGLPARAGGPHPNIMKIQI
uniref:Uncharacterized protein n=1 Tax=Marmota marmota marmota TaxID=9994 RepID=A0A8C5YS14_MARMA